MINMSQSLHQHLGQNFTRLCTPIPMFHIFSEVVSVHNVVTSKCQTVFPAILPDPLAIMRAIDKEKCTGLIGAPIIFRDILNHPDRKKYDLSSLIYSGLGASPMHIDFLRELEKEIPIKRVAQLYGMTENAAILTSSMWTDYQNQNVKPGQEIFLLWLHIIIICKKQMKLIRSRWFRIGDEGSCLYHIDR